jgi:hypothetical protein
VCVLLHHSLLDLGKDGAGRQQVLTDMHLCGNATSALPHYGAVLGLQNDIIGTFQGLAQVSQHKAVCG